MVYKYNCVQKTHRKSELEWISNASCNESSDWRRQNVQCPYEQLQQSLIFRIQLCVSTLSKDQQQSCLVAFAEHFPTTRNLSWFALLDLSAAFDTVDHHILLDRLQSAFAIRGSVIDWIQSFITNRSQTVSFAGDVSTESVVTCGVPQGSVLGPILFLLYTADVTNIALRCGLNVHSYADDTHLYVHCDAVNCAAEAARLAACIEELDGWALSYLSFGRGPAFLSLKSQATTAKWLSAYM